MKDGANLTTSKQVGTDMFAEELNLFDSKRDLQNVDASEGQAIGAQNGGVQTVGVHTNTVGVQTNTT